jgi:hypothetical protein
VQKDAVAIGALLGAIAGAAVGAYVYRVWTSEPTDADDFGHRLANLEAEIEELERLQRERKAKRNFDSASQTRPSQAPQPLRSPAAAGQPRM